MSPTILTHRVKQQLTSSSVTENFSNSLIKKDQTRKKYVNNKSLVINQTRSISSRKINNTSWWLLKLNSTLKKMMPSHQVALAYRKKIIDAIESRRDMEKYCNSYNFEFMSSLQVTITFGDIELLEKLLKAGINPNKKSYNYYYLSSLSALMYAISPFEYESFDENTMVKMIDLLITYGGNINERYSNGDSLLDRAIGYNCLNVAKLLIRHGICTKNARKKTATFLKKEL